MQPPGVATILAASLAIGVALALITLRVPSWAERVSRVLLTRRAWLPAVGAGAIAMVAPAELRPWLFTLLGAVYTTIPLSIIVWVKSQPGGGPLALFTMAAVWASDSTAYFVGKAVGRHLAFPRISPKKTWEGVAGSVAGALIVGIGAHLLFFHDWTVIVLALGVNVAAQFGDLAESALKRSAGVKDSSQLVPGHGGVLDRIDALLFAAPLLWYYWLLTGR